MPLKLQTEEINGAVYAKVKDGKPLYIEDSNGTEVAYDAEGSANTIRSLNREAKTHREGKEAAELQLKAFNDIDPEKARSALEMVSNIDAGQLLNAEKVAEIKLGVEKATEKKYEGQLGALQTREKALIEERDGFHRSLDGERLRNMFATSKFVADKMGIPAPAVQKIFGEHFAFEGEMLVAKDANGVQLYSQERPAQDPTFEEALSMIVNSYPYKDTIMKGNNNSGGGGGGGPRAPFAPGDKKLTRKEFEAKGPGERMKAMKEGYTVVD